VLGLDAGADDYLVKPFAFPELGARIRVLLRRNKADSESALKIGDLEIDPVRRTVYRKEHRIDLTAREFDLLEYLARNHCRVVSREMFARDVWKENARNQAQTRLEQWYDVPPASMDYLGAQRSLKEHVAMLIDELASQ
jgi:two-component system, OmpR family, copper resistance phosphate regulon response regulator CusR